MLPGRPGTRVCARGRAVRHVLSQSCQGVGLCMHHLGVELCSSHYMQELCACTCAMRWADADAAGGTATSVRLCCAGLLSVSCAVLLVMATAHTVPGCLSRQHCSAACMSSWEVEGGQGHQGRLVIQKPSGAKGLWHVRPSRSDPATTFLCANAVTESHVVILGVGGFQ